MSYIPKKPFEDYKWLFATKAPTESLGDPAILLGLINRLLPIANKNIRYSSEEFASIMRQMAIDVPTTINLAERVGERNLMRNSAQYWKIFGLIPNDSRGVINITPFAEKIISGEINQVEFASAIIVSLKLPNNASYRKDYHKWRDNELLIHPFKLILKVVRHLFKQQSNEAWLTNEELYSIIIPMAGDKQKPEFIAQYVLEFRQNPEVTKNWYNAVPRANDKRFSGEFLRFLANFGFLEKEEYSNANLKNSNDYTKYYYISQIDEQIKDLVDGTWSENREEIIAMVRNLDINTAVVQAYANRTSSRPNQQAFRRELLATTPICPITDTDLPVVLQAAHIKPYAQGGEDKISNGLMLRADIHLLFDAGALNLKLDPFKKGYCNIILANNDQIRKNYQDLKESIKLPEHIDIENIRWRTDNPLTGIG